MTKQQKSPGQSPRQAYGAGRFQDKYETSILLSLGVVVALRLWLSPLRSSFWIDETGTAWAIGGSFHDLLAHLSFNFFPQMPLFCMSLWAWSRVAGLSETALRLPSLIAIAAASVMLWRLALRLCDRTTAAYTLLLLASLSHVSFAAADARPYGLAILCVVWILHERVLWIQTGKTRHLVLLGVAYSLVFYLHYLFGAVLAADAAYLIVAHGMRWIRLDRAVLISPLIALIACLPLVPRLAVISGDRALHVVSGPLSWSDLGVLFTPPRWIVAGVLATGLMLVLMPSRIKTPKRPDLQILTMFSIWSTVPAFTLFVYSLASGSSVMWPRYLLSQAPATVLLGAYLVSRLQPAVWRISFALILFAIAFASGGRAVSTQHDSEDWRGAHAAINQLRARDPLAPVLMSSSFIESDRIPLPPTAEIRECLLAPLKAYPVPGPITMLPLDLNTLNEQYVRDVLGSAASANRFIVLLKSNSNLVPWMHGLLDQSFETTEIYSNPVVLLLKRR